MIPVSDAVRSRTFPFVNIALIVANFAVFIYELTLSQGDINRFFFDHGVVPYDLSHWVNHPAGLHEPGTIITSAFIHGGWLHILGNMLFLWVFGDNVEDALGHLKYLAFYLVSAVGAVALQVAIDTNGTLPMIGASGAIAGVLGGYIVLYPTARVSVLFFIVLLPVPAFLLIGFWFFLQFFAGLASIGKATGVNQGIAVWAHVGGFVTGLALVLLARPFIRRRPQLSGPRGRSMW